MSDRTKAKMKISFPRIGPSQWGGDQMMAKIANGLAKRGHEVNIIFVKKAYLWKFKTAANVREIRHGKCYYGKFGLLLDSAFSVPSSDIICATHGLSALPVLIASKILKKGMPFYLVQNWDSLFYDKPKDWFYRQLINKTYKYFDNFITVAKWLDDKIYETTGKRTTIIHPGIDFSIFYLRKVKKDSKIKTILCLGRKEKIKGFPDLIKAMELVYQKRRDIKLTIVSRLKIDINLDVPYTQRQATDDELAELYSSCDVFVLPSWIEGCPAPPLEAMACGAPVVATDCLGVREYAKNGENCLMVPPQRPRAMAEAILRILKDKNLTKKLRENGPKTAKQFTWDKTTDEVEKLFLSKLNERK